MQNVYLNFFSDSKMPPKAVKPRKVKGCLVFKDFPEFKPHHTPSEVFKMGAFGGTYWRPIKSKFFSKKLSGYHKNYPAEWWKGLPESHLTSPNYDVNVNKYKAKCGASLEEWESKDWIKKSHPYGWFHWYCDFYQGKRCSDDERQIGRWLKLAGPKGRFRKWLITQITKKGGKWDDTKTSPAIRQTLLH